jgi:thiol-disulfide isomerase/thioredoxin
MADVQPYWILIAGLITLYLFALLFVSWRPSGRGRSSSWWFGPGGTQQHLLGPGGTRQMLYGAEGFADSGKPTFYMFGVDWCPHCVKAKPEFEQLTKTIGDRVNVVYVNPEKNKTAASGFEIEGYPTFYLVKDGQKIKYSGDRKQGAFESWLRSELA